MLRAGILLVATVVLFSNTAKAQQTEATPQEAIQRVVKAAQHLSRKGRDGIMIFNLRNSDFVWKDSYVFVIDCQAGRIVAHPIQQSLIGREIATFKDAAGKLFGP